MATPEFYRHGSSFHQSSTGSALASPEFDCNAASRTGVLPAWQQFPPAFYWKFIVPPVFDCNVASRTGVLPAWQRFPPAFYWKLSMATPVAALGHCLGGVPLVFPATRSDNVVVSPS